MTQDMKRTCRQLCACRLRVLVLVWLAAVTGILAWGQNQQAGNAQAREALLKGVQAYQSGDWDEAMSQLQRAVEIDPSRVDAYLQLAAVYAQPQVGKGDLAITTYKKVLHLEPGNAAALAGVRDVYLRLKKFDEARAYFEQESQTAPQNAEVHYSIGFINWAQVWQLSRKLKSDLGLKPSDTIEPASKRDGHCSYAQPLIAQAIQALNKAIDLKPENGQAVAYLNLIYREKADCQATPEARNRDLAEAKRLEAKAIELIKKAAPSTQLAPPPPPPPKKS